KFYLTCHHVIEGETTTTIGHVANLDPGLMPEHLKRKMLKCAVAGRGHIDAVRCGFCVGDDISHGFHRHRWRHHQDVRHQRHERDGVEVLVVVEGQARIERGVDG